jgi:hypothetical protein
MRVTQQGSPGGGGAAGGALSARPRLRWVPVTGADGRQRMEMRWDVRQPASTRLVHPRGAAA